jgi:RimJ/RimL family protein N-acetyltransferase
MNMDWRERIAPEVEMRHIDGEILRRTELDNHDEVENWVRSNWGTEENFLENGFGVVLMGDDGILSWSLADGVSGDRCEIGIHTDDDHRKKGLGSTAVAANVEYAQTNGFRRIGWHCGETNIGSIKTAERVGFELVRKYHVFEGWFAPFDQYLELGWYYYRKGDYGKSAEYYEKCFALGNMDFPDEKFWIGASGETLAKSFFYYNGACAWALAGEKENALKNLNLAIDWGWSHFDHLKNDDDLKSLHNETAWKEILERIEDSVG